MQGYTLQVMPFVIPMVAYAQDVVNIMLLSKDFFNLLANNDVLWYNLCTAHKFSVGDSKLSCHTWKDVYKLMYDHEKLKNLKKQEFKLVTETWLRKKKKSSSFLWYYRQAKVRGLNTVVQFEEIGAFKRHPEESVDPVLKFSMNMIVGAKVMLDLYRYTRIANLFTEESFISKAIQRYVNFLHLKVTHKHVQLIPTLEIAFVWMCHMIRPLMYQKDCLALFGEIVEHNILLTNSYKSFHKAEALVETQILYEKEFQEPYCSSALIAEQCQSNFTISGVAPLRPRPKRFSASSPPPWAGSKKPAANIPSTAVQEQEVEWKMKKIPMFFQPQECIPNQFAPSFVAESGVTFEKTQIKKLISLEASDILAERLWFDNFESFMKHGGVKEITLDDFIASATRGRECLDVNIRPPRNGCGFPSLLVFQRMLKGYERFLYLATRYPAEKSRIRPTLPIEFMWRVHMTNPRQYMFETTSWTGNMLDHMCNDGNNVDMELADALWHKEFGTSIHEEHTTMVVVDFDPNKKYSF